jgi:Mn2+/Fe2+ NRAMP family transporter
MFTPGADRRSLLDRAHRGDIEGAFGRLAAVDTGPRRSRARRLAALAAIVGPGVIVMVADNDAGGVSVYAQAGQDHGLALAWLIVLLAPVLFVNQEMVARLGAVTGAGHARLIFERFGRRWGRFAVGDLLVLNLLTIVTELIGVALALSYFGVSRYVSVPLAAVALIAATSTGSFRRWERTMCVLVSLNLLVVPLVVLSHPGPSAVAHGLAPVFGGGLSGQLLLFVIAMVGTTVAPWQLFLQQSSVIDKRITARWLSYERVDTLIGTVLFAVVAIAVLGCCALAFDATPFHGSFVDAAQTARGLQARLGGAAGALFALVLLNASVLGAGVVALSGSYAIGDVLGVKHSLHRRFGDARAFHGSFAALIALAAFVLLAPGAPLGLVTTLVQALAGVLLPGATVFLLLLCNDRAVLGPWVNPRWLNAAASLVVGILVVLSALLTTSTLAPGIDLVTVAVGLGSVLVAVLVGLAIAHSRGHPEREAPGMTPWEARTWTMPRLESLPPPRTCRERTIGLVALRCYLLTAAALLVFKAFELLS